LLSDKDVTLCGKLGVVRGGLDREQGGDLPGKHGKVRENVFLNA